MRKLRLAKGLTLMALSRRTGVPLSTLSKLELGQSTLTYDKWALICRALDVEPEDEILRSIGGDSPAVSGRRSVTHKGEGAAVQAGPYKLEIAATDLMAKAFTPMIVELTARTLEEHGPLRRTPGEMFIYAVEGFLRLCSEDYGPLTLSPGDGVFFDGGRGHALLAVDDPARALLVHTGEGPFWP